MGRMKIGSLFSGYGGLDMGVQAVVGGETVWHVEFDEAPSKILAHHWNVPNYGDIRNVDWSSVEPVDVLTGGFPCQDVSLAGRRAGITAGTRSGLWSEFAHAIDVLQPKLVVIENVRGLLSATADGNMESDPWGVGDGATRPVVNAFGVVLGDLASLGYDARWCGVRAADAGAPHGRFRVFCVAHPASARRGEGQDRRAGRGDAGARPRGMESERGSGERTDATQDADVATGGERWLSASGKAEGGRARADTRRRSGTPVADTRSDEPERRGRAADMGSAPSSRETDREERERVRNPPVDRSPVDWGQYELAVRRWERVTRRVAPAPTNPDGKNKGHRLSSRFVEWMMGLPEGHVTDVGLTRNQQLKALGNGVVPQQAELAVKTLLEVS